MVGGLSYIVNALNMYPNDYSVIRYCSQIISQVATKSKSVSFLLGEMNCIKNLISSLDMQPESDDEEIILMK